MPCHAGSCCAVLCASLQVIYDAVATFVQELRAGGPMRSGVAQPKAAPAQSVDAAVAAAAGEANGSSAPAAAAATQPVAAAEKENATETPAGSGHSIELREKFFAGAAGEACRLAAATPWPRGLARSQLLRFSLHIVHCPAPDGSAACVSVPMKS